MNNIDINQADFNELQNIALEMFEKFVYNRADLSQEEFEKKLRTYTRRILNVNLAKDGIDNAKIDIKSESQFRKILEERQAEMENDDSNTDSEE